MTFENQSEICCRQQLIFIGPFRDCKQNFAICKSYVNRVTFTFSNPHTEFCSAPFKSVQCICIEYVDSPCEEKKGLVSQKIRNILSAESCEMSENPLTISKRHAPRYFYFIFGRVRSRKKDHHIHNLLPSMFIFIFQCLRDCFTFSFACPS